MIRTAVFTAAWVSADAAATAGGPQAASGADALLPVCAVLAAAAVVLLMRGRGADKPAGSPDSDPASSNAGAPPQTDTAQTTRQRDLEAEVRERTEDLRRARDEARAASRAKSEFLATMSHEIRTPLNAIIGMTHLALNSEMTPRTRGYVGKAHKSAQSLLAIVNDILDVSKIESGKMALESTPFRLEDVMEHLADTIALKAEEKGLELLFDSEPDVPTALIGDPLRLGQVLINLGNNAVKFTDAGEIVVQVRVEARSSRHVELQFSISDTGIGLSDAQQAKLFQAFSQADTSITRRFGGTGLGLAISKHLTEMMGGRIWVDSAPGSGSTFHFTARFEVQAADRDTGEPGARGEQRRVLVVDDNDTARRIHAMIAESVGLRVTTAADGAAAIDAVVSAEREGDPYQLVLMDWRMPGIDGLTAARAIATDKALSRKPRVVVISAYGHDEVADATSDLAIAGCLTKPITAAAVLDALDAPAEKPKRSETPLPMMQHDPDPTDVEQIRHAHVLVVEDHEINQELLVELLSAHGVYADVAANGREALDKAASGAYDAVLMDIQMPIMDGYEAAQAMRDKPALAEIPIIAMTAGVLQRDRERAADAGINDFIVKPIDVRALFATLAQWVGPDGWTAPMRPPVLSSTLEPGGRFESRLQRLPSASAPAREQTVLYRSMLARFREQYLDFPERFKAALDEEGPAAPVRLTHALKGVAANLGATRIARAAEQLETACADDPRSERAERMLERTAAELKRFAAGLEEAPADDTAPASAPAVPALSPAEINRGRQLAGQLKRLLEDNDAEALSAAAALADLLGRDAELGKRARACSERVQRFEFGPASELLESITAELTQPPG